MKTNFFNLPRLFLFALGLLAILATAQAQTTSLTVNVERYTDLGGGQVRKSIGTLSSDGIFTRSGSSDFSLTFLNMTTGTLAAVNDKFVIQVVMYNIYSSGAGYAAAFPRSTQVYDIYGGDYYVITASGTGLIPTNPTTPAASLKPVNVSTLTLCPAGGSVTAGFVLDGTGSQQVLIRAIGPGLTPLGVGGVLANPKLTVNKGSAVLKINDDWSAVAPEATALSAAFAATGAFGIASGSKDSAVLLTLDAGSYTAQATSVDTAASGLIILEVYILKN